ncbi:hypothetical protein [Allomuricauda sp. d1]
MENDSTIGIGFLNAFLRFMVIALIIILIAIPVCMILEFLGVFDALGIF